MKRLLRTLLPIAFTLVGCGDDSVDASDAASSPDTQEDGASADVNLGDTGAPQDGGADSMSDTSVGMDTGADVLDAAMDVVTMDAATDAAPDAGMDAGAVGTCAMMPAGAICAGFESMDEGFRLSPGTELRPGEGVMGSTAACTTVPSGGQTDPRVIRSLDPAIDDEVVYLRAYYRMEPLTSFRMTILEKVDRDPGQGDVTLLRGNGVLRHVSSDMGNLLLVGQSEPDSFPFGEWACVQTRIENQVGGRFQVWVDGREVINETGYTTDPSPFDLVIFGGGGSVPDGMESDFCLDEVALSVTEMPPCL